MKRWIVPILASLWVAVFSNYAFAPYSHSFLVWLAPWGLFFLEARNRGKYKKLFWLGCLVSVFFYSFSFNWIIHMTVTFGGFPLFLALPLFVISAVFLNLWFPLFLMLFSFLVKKIKREFIWLAGLVALIGEFGTPQVFPWYWGSVVAGNDLLAQTAEYFSIYGLSFLLFVVSYSIYSWIGKDILNFLFLFKRTGIFQTENLASSIKKQFSLLSHYYPALILYLFFLTLGSYLYIKWDSVEPESYVDTLMVQPNAPLEFRDGRSVAETMNDLMERIERLTLEGAASHPDPLDLVVLPESGVPFFSTHKHSATTYPPLYWEQFDSLMFILANRLNTNVFFNELDASYKDDKRSRENLRYYNSSTVFDPNGERKLSYQKVFLLIFGEYMPFDWMYALSPQTGRFEPGTSLDLLNIYKKESGQDWDKAHLTFKDTKTFNRSQVGDYYASNKLETQKVAKFLPLICYEVIIPEFVRKFHPSGNPDFFVNVTNDKWYGVSAETFQHGDLARIRTIEWRKWMVRSTNSGSSFFVDHLGRVVDNEFTGQESSEFLRKKVGIVKSEPTFYVLYGNILVWITLLGLGLRYVYLGWFGKSQTISSKK
ncbi:MAG: apolipoprotein N-acyltransferase [Leptospira sp.]|nr:apolipoprotein N-acyltransferase [Leptospira sp.]